MAVLPVILFSALLTGCVDSTANNNRPEQVWGRKGLDEGRFIKPRAMTIDDQDRLYIVDKTGRIQVFDRDGQFQHGWRIPDVYQGKPVGLSMSQDGNLLVCDTHYFRMLVYTPEGELLDSRTLGGVNGRGPGEFGFLTDVVQDAAGNYYIAEYGDFDRIQKFSPDGSFLCQFGSHGEGDGEFLRPQSLAFDADGKLWVADACNHRLQVFDVSGDQPTWVRSLGTSGSEPGQLSYPYAIEFDAAGNLLVCEFGNHRVQRLRPDGISLGCWGSPGHDPGQLQQPWAICLDSRGAVHVADTYNHRIQRFQFPAQTTLQPNTGNRD